MPLDFVANLKLPYKIVRSSLMFEIFRLFLCKPSLRKRIIRLSLCTDQLPQIMALCILFLLITLRENDRSVLLKLQILRQPGLFQVHTVMTHPH